MSDTVVELERVYKIYGDFTAVEDLSFTIGRGQIFGFLGPNGAGKTTTMRMILDILRPSFGKITILGAESAFDVRERVGYLPEERGLYRKMKAADVIAYFGALKGLPRGEAKRRAKEMMERFGLGEFTNRKVQALSKGMAQKVQLIAALVHDPEFVILDEPFSGLDPVNQQVFEDMILEEKAKGRTIVFSTHVMQHAERLCDKLLLVGKGRKVFEGTLAQARQQLPDRIRVETRDDPARLRDLPGIAAVRLVKDGYGGHGATYEIDLDDGANPQIVLRRALDTDIAIDSFDRTEASLHEVFVKLIGGADAGEA